jgi:hypothetical protein
MHLSSVFKYLAFKDSVFNTAIATAALALIAGFTVAPQAQAYDVALCQASSDLAFVDENGQPGYYRNGEQFACTTPDGEMLVGQKNDRLVVIVNGAVIVNGTPAVFEAGQGRSAGRSDSRTAEITPRYSTTDYVDSAVYDAGYRTDYGDGSGGYINTYESSYP